MDQYKETFATWDKLAQLYQDQFMDLDLYNNTYDHFCQLVHTTNANLLEIGCGPGNITQYLLNKRPDFIIHGIDVAPNMIQLAAQNNPTASFATMDCRDIAALDTEYDAIICGFCIPYLSPADCDKLITDCADLLHANGLFYLSFVEGDSNRSGYLTGSTGDRTYFYFYQRSYIEAALTHNGFTIVYTHIKDYPKADGTCEQHIIVIAQKQLRLMVD